MRIDRTAEQKNGKTDGKALYATKTAESMIRLGSSDLASERFRGCNGILLDFGGTLDSDGEHWLDRFYGLYEQAGLKIDPAEIKRVFYRADDFCCRDEAINNLGLRPLMIHHVRLQFQALGLKNPQLERWMADRFCSQIESFLERNAVLLERLRPRYRLGVVSNFYGNVETLCREASLSRYLDVVLDSIRVGVSKPNPVFFQMALEALGLPASQVIFVGDSYDRDMMPARKLGMKTIWMKGPNPRIPENPEPVDAWITSLSELERLVQ